jgi:anti-anti-sigma factor
MTRPILHRPGPESGVSPGTRPKGAVRAPGPASPPVLPEEAAEGPEPDEALVIDARGALTPSRVVEQRLAALLRAGRSGLGEAGRALERRRPPGPAVGRPGNVSVVTFTGARAREPGSGLAEEIEGCAQGALDGDLLLDFANVHFIGSAELGALVGLHTAVKSSGGRLTLVNLSPRLLEVFTVTRLHALLAICRGPQPCGGRADVGPAPGGVTAN